ncbi:MAG: hypothetical protein HW421_1934 [Ignavibacteria bacterium]|nr:hypothetical protein [Ignavibacteria bacterium]
MGLTNKFFLEIPMKKRFFFGWIFNYCFMFILIFFPQKTISAELPSMIQNDSLQVNMVNLTVDKFIDTYFFTGNSNLFLKTKFGTFNIDQKYRSAALMMSNKAIRDDETFCFDYLYPISGNFYLTARQNFLWSADRRAIGINKTQDIYNTAGIRYDFLPNSFIDLKAGYENNNQIGVKAGGAYYMLGCRITDLNVEEFKLNSYMSGNYAKLSDNRMNSDLDFRTSIARQYDFFNNIELKFRYRQLGRDLLLPPWILGGVNPIELRNENGVSGEVNTNFKISDFASELKLSFDNTTKTRSFNSSLEQASLTKIQTNLNNLQIGVAGQVKYEYGKFEEILGAGFYSVTEENRIGKKFQISKDDEDLVRNQENQKDYNYTRALAFSKSRFCPGSFDTIILNHTSEILQYDTPSSRNSDDRDEFLSSTQIRYSHRFSSILLGSLTFEALFMHLVYLKSQMSSANSWNRVLKFAPQIFVETESVKFHPSFEVLANYRIYDYDSLSSGVDLTSLRQISYRDTITISLYKKFNLQSTIIVRYFENGILYWRTFSESPQNSNFEQFTRLMLLWDKSDGTQIAAGCRYFNIRQALMVGNATGKIKYHGISVGPEVLIKIFFKSGSSVVFQGWYEFQNPGKPDYRNVPNFSLQTNFRL